MQGGPLKWDPQSGTPLLGLESGMLPCPAGLGGWRGKKKILQKGTGEDLRCCSRGGCLPRGAPAPGSPRRALGRASEVQGREVPKVTVKELADALALLQAEVVVLCLRRRQVDELIRQETRKILPALVQEGVHGGQWRQARLLHRALAGQPARPRQQRLCGDGKQP